MPLATPSQTQTAARPRYSSKADRREPKVATPDRVFKVLRAPIAGPLAEFSACLLMIPVLLSVALWNGFPLIFYDTGAYILQGLGRVFVVERSPVYSLFLDYGGGGRSLWFIAAIQAALTSFVIVETARC